MDKFSYEPPSHLLDQRVILITGAGGGLGSTLARKCAVLGATVILLGRSQRKLEALYDQIENDGGSQAAILPMNLMTATWGDYEALASTIEQGFGRLDGIVHAATHFKSFARLEDLDPREWMDGLQVNLTAIYTMTRVCLPLLRRAEDASVIHISDGISAPVRPLHGIYGMTKSAADQMIHMWAVEHQSEPSLRFNSVDPGPMRTAHRNRGYAGESAHESPAPETRLDRLLWLLGPDSREVSGEAF